MYSLVTIVVGFYQRLADPLIRLNRRNPYVGVPVSLSIFFLPVLVLPFLESDFGEVGSILASVTIAITIFVIMPVYWVLVEDFWPGIITVEPFQILAICAVIALLLYAGDLAIAGLF